jgi:hypothetical protein
MTDAYDDPEFVAEFADMTDEQREIGRAVMVACSDAQLDMLLSGDDAYPMQIAGRMVETLSPAALKLAAQLGTQHIIRARLLALRALEPPPDP